MSGQTYQLSKSLRLLGSAEDNSKLAAALQQLADVEEKVEKVHEQQAKDDFYLLSELIHDYIGIVGAVKDAFNERVKAWQSWQSVQVRLIWEHLYISIVELRFIIREIQYLVDNCYRVFSYKG